MQKMKRLLARFVTVSFCIMLLFSIDQNSVIQYFPLLSYHAGAGFSNPFFLICDYASDKNGEASNETKRVEDHLKAGEPKDDNRIYEIKGSTYFDEESIPCVQTQGNFQLRQQKIALDYTIFNNYDKLLKEFYTIDSLCLAGEDLFNIEDLYERDMTLQKKVEGPQILIYHTHSKEQYKWVENGENGGVLEAGDYLSAILEKDYGYHVLHLREEFDTIRDHAYSNALPKIEQILKENPSIEVVIDLHRDSGNANREIVYDADGLRCARFMFFNGISRSKSKGDIAYLKNENLKDNLAFSFQMQSVLSEYYPGLTRKIYIKQYRFNMHVKPRTLLVELGDENNTLKEAKNSCILLAYALDLVLSGKR